MASSSPNFYRILSDTIAKSGLQEDEKARGDLYQRARVTVVDRARANNAPNVDELEAHLNKAIEQIESELTPPSPDPVEASEESAEEPEQDAPIGLKPRMADTLASIQAGGHHPETVSDADAETDTGSEIENVEKTETENSLGKLKLSTLFSKPKPEEDASDDASKDDPSLDRIAADLAAGFKEIDFDAVTPSSDRQSDLAGTEPDADASIPMSGIDRNFDSPEEQEIEPLSSDDGLEVDQEEEPVSANKDKAPGPLSLRNLLLGLLVLAAGFWLGTLVATMRIGPSTGAITPDPSDLAGASWRAQNTTVEVSSKVTWNGFDVVDASDDRHATLSIPVDPSQVPNGFRVTARVAKAEQPSRNRTLLRVRYASIEQNFLFDVLLDARTGEFEARGSQAEESVSIVDEGDSLVVSFSVPGLEELYFQNPLVQIFPAISGADGRYRPATTGTVTIGEVKIEPL